LEIAFSRLTNIFRQFGRKYSFKRYTLNPKPDTLNPIPYTLLVGLLLLAPALQAQITVSLQQPPPNQLKVADLWRVTILNTTKTTYNVYLQGTATEANAGQVVDAQTSPFTVPPGSKVVTGHDLGNIKVNSSNSKYKNILLQTGSVPAGDYTVCVIVHAAQDGSELGNDCIQQHVESATLMLITPNDEAPLDVDLPVFIWTSSPPLGTSATYGMKIVEVLGNQTPFAAMQANTPFFVQSSLHTSTLQYPVSAPKFIPGRNYGWQITAADNGATLSQSEVWSFTSKPADSIVAYKLVIKKKFISQFEEAYGGTNLEYGLSIQQTKDTGFIIAGYTRSFGAGNNDAYLVKTDAGGNIQWSMTYGGDNDDEFYAVKQCPDGGYIAVGATRSFDVGNDDIYVVKTDAQGKPEWSRAIGGGGVDVGYDVVASPDGFYAIAGIIGKGDDYDGYVAVLNKGGGPVGGTNVGKFACDAFHGLAMMGDGFVAAGYTRSMGVGNDDMYLASFDREGGYHGSLSYGSYYFDRAFGITAINADICAAVGVRPDNNILDPADICVLRTAPSFTNPSVELYNGGRLELGMSIHGTPDRGLVIGGYLFGDSAHHAGGGLALGINALGKVAWSRIYTGSLADAGMGITPTLDGGVAMTGLTDRGSGMFDAWLVKTDNMGTVGCTDQDATMINENVVGTWAPQPKPMQQTSLYDRGLNVREVPTRAIKAATVAMLLCPKSGH
jgi:hypothetical protein